MIEVRPQWRPQFNSLQGKSTWVVVGWVDTRMPNYLHALSNGSWRWGSCGEHLRVTQALVSIGSWYLSTHSHGHLVTQFGRQAGHAGNWMAPTKGSCASYERWTAPVHPSNCLSKYRKQALKNKNKALVSAPMITFFGSHFSNKQSCSNSGKNENIKLPSPTIAHNKRFRQILRKYMTNSQ